MEFIGNTSFDFMGRRKLALICSAILIIIGVASLFTRGLNWGIEFTGGTLVQVAYENPVQIKDIRDQLAEVCRNDA